ncbi:MAG: hypothetical protein J07HX5_01875 [halophilic archaeon J07HX5]|jgi:hypothetical protein|nr:MAG: hypothetical protein J07HX5_01875 [halophilic archaeon J07HX5]
MTPPASDRSAPVHTDDLALGCDACQAALATPGRDSISFLLTDHLTLPIVGCDEHLETFRAACALATTATAETLAHQPAGGVRCPACRLAHSTAQPVVPVTNGAVAVLGCPDHTTALIDRFHTGLEARRQLTASAKPF